MDETGFASLAVLMRRISQGLEWVGSRPELRAAKQTL